ncbi:hypothetical protein [Burkholderia stabilis]|uniref:hypothetical protein n=1 Tax=Burkholderia stabilis TaxID=95485 RepID=UPI001F4ADFB3|nr:hypothetical protein [Burkholderia stabilis]
MKRWSVMLNGVIDHEYCFRPLQFTGREFSHPLSLQLPEKKTVAEGKAWPKNEENKVHSRSG